LEAIFSATKFILMHNPSWKQTLNSYSSVLVQIDIEDEFTHQVTIDRCDPFQQVSQFCICCVTHFNKCPNFIFVAWAISTSTTVLYFVSNSCAQNHIHCLCIREGEKEISQLVPDKILLQKSLHIYKKKLNTQKSSTRISQTPSHACGRQKNLISTRIQN
jgi:hypothetical protein